MPITLANVVYRLVNYNGETIAIRQIRPGLWRQASASITRKLLAGLYLRA